MFQGEQREPAYPMDWRRQMPFVAVVLSILAFVAWLIFILLYALFWSTSYSLFQNIVVTIVSLLLVGLVVGLIWVVWGMRFARTLSA